MSEVPMYLDRDAHLTRRIATSLMDQGGVVVFRVMAPGGGRVRLRRSVSLSLSVRSWTMSAIAVYETPYGVRWRRTLTAKPMSSTLRITNSYPQHHQPSRSPALKITNPHHQPSTSPTLIITNPSSLNSKSRHTLHKKSEIRSPERQPRICFETRFSEA